MNEWDRLRYARHTRARPCVRPPRLRSDLLALLRSWHKRSTKVSGEQMVDERRQRGRLRKWNSIGRFTEINPRLYHSLSFRHLLSTMCLLCLVIVLLPQHALSYYRSSSHLSFPPFIVVPLPLHHHSLSSPSFSFHFSLFLLLIISSFLFSSCLSLFFYNLPYVDHIVVISPFVSFSLWSSCSFLIAKISIVVE